MNVIQVPSIKTKDTVREQVQHQNVFKRSTVQSGFWGTVFTVQSQQKYDLCMVVSFNRLFVFLLY